MSTTTRWIMRPVVTVGQLLIQIIEEYHNPRAVSSYIDNKWVSLSSKELIEQIKWVSLGLLKLGYKKGDKIGIIAPPSSRWTIADLAIMSFGGISVPLFSNISEENFQYEIHESGLKSAFISGDEAWSRYDADKHLFSRVFSLEESDARPEATSYQELLRLGKEYEAANPNLWMQNLNDRKPDEEATYVFTSGSTGTPKGVIHTQCSMTSLQSDDVLLWDNQTDTYLSFLPLAHITARCINMIMLGWGVSIFYWNDLKNIGAACKELHPTLMVVVPRLLEKVYAKMVAGVENAGYLKRTIGHWAFDLANQEENTVMKTLFHPLAEKLVYGHLREALGGSLRVILCGGAPLDPHLCRFFMDVGFPIYEGWGLTEICPTTVNPAFKSKAGSVGPPIPGVEIKVADDGELLARGSNIMKGYLHNPEETREAIDSDGWFHTGDKGTIDSEGYVYIIGRIKELLKTSNGKMIAPVPIEHTLKKAPFIEMAVVIAEGKKFPSALLIPDFEILKKIKADHNAADQSDEEFLNGPYINEETQNLIHRINEHLNHWEQIQSFRFIPHPLSIDKGELTPSMKIVRESITKNYKNLIDSMYIEAEEQNNERT